MRKLFKKLLAVVLVGAMLGSVGCNDYDDDIDALNKRVDEIEGVQIKAVNEQIASMQSSIASLQSAQTATQAAVDALKATVATLETKADHDADVAALEAKIAAANQSIAALEAEVDEINATIATIEAAMKEMATMSWVEATLKAYATQEEVAKEIGDLWATVTPATIRISDLESQMTENGLVDAEQQAAIDAATIALANLEAEIENVKKWVEEYVSEAIYAAGSELWTRYLTHLAEFVYPDIDALYAAVAANEAAVEAAKKELSEAITAGDEALKAQIEAEIAKLQAEHTTLEAAMAAADAQLQQNIDEVADALEAAVVSYEAALKAAKEELAEAIAAGDEALKAQIESEISAMEAALATVESDYKAADVLLQNQIDQLIADVANLKLQTGEMNVADAIAKAIEENNGYLEAEFAKAMEEIKKAAEGFEKDIAALQKELLAANVNIQALISRVQSLVYVPDYADHKATVPALITIDNKAETPAWDVMGEGNFIMNFRVTPASLAMKIAALDNAAFGFMFEEVKATRAATYGLEILEVGYNPMVEDGMIQVRVQPTLPKEFYQRAIEALADEDWNTYGALYESIDFDAARSFSAALTLKASYEDVKGSENMTADAGTATDIMSNYVNLFPAATVVDEMVLISETDTLMVGESKKYEIEYDDVEKKVALLEGYEPAIKVGEYYKKLDELGYVLPETTVECVNQAYTKDDKAAELEDANFTVTGTEEACDEVVGLAKLDKYSVGNYLLTEHTFTVGSLSATFSTEVEIIKAYKTVTFEDWTYYWWYQDYLAATEAQVEYEGSKLTVVLPVKESLLPEDVTPEQVVKYWTTKPVSVEVDGEESEMTVTPVAYDEEKGYTLEITGWNFAEEAQLIEATCEYATIDVKFVINANFINLPEEIAAELAPATMTYDNTLDVFVSEGEAVVETLYAQVTNHFEDATELATSLSKDNSEVRYKATLGEGEEATEVTPGKKHTFLNKNASYTMIRVKNDGEMTSIMEVLKSDVTAAGDTFNFTTTFTPAYGSMAIIITGTATVEAPAYAIKHNDVWVAYNAETASYYSNVKGLWMPDGKLNPISSFSTEDVALEEAFEIVKIVDGKAVAVTDEEIAAQGLAMSFALDKEYEGIEIADNLLTYNGKEEKVGVDGELYVGSLLIPTAFNEYENYEVFGYDPIGAWTVDPEEVISTENAQPTYSVNIINKLSLKDVRGYELISEEAADITAPWIVGDDENGFVSTISPKDVFSLSDLKVTHRFSEAATGFDTDVLNGRVVVDDTTGQVTFNNLNNMALQKDVILEVTVTLSYPWGEDKVGVVTYRITK